VTAQPSSASSGVRPAPAEDVVARLKRLRPGEGRIGGDDLYLLPVVHATVQDDAAVETLARWRDAAQHGFATTFRVTHAGTREWLRDLVLQRPDRILFYVCEAAGRAIGHLGLTNIDPAHAACMMDNVIRGERPLQPDSMARAVDLLAEWCFATLGMREISLVVLNDNVAGLRLYAATGFRPVSLIYLQRHESAGRVDWLETEDVRRADRMFVKLTRRLGEEPSRSGYQARRMP
jgi:RimJ/RimL family protein N-acetyltransferase